MCRVVLYVAFMAKLQVLVDSTTCCIFVLLFLCVFSVSFVIQSLLVVSLVRVVSSRSVQVNKGVKIWF